MKMSPLTSMAQFSVCQMGITLLASHHFSILSLYAYCRLRVSNYKFIGASVAECMDSAKRHLCNIKEERGGEGFGLSKHMVNQYILNSQILRLGQAGDWMLKAVRGWCYFIKHIWENYTRIIQSGFRTDSSRQTSWQELLPFLYTSHHQVSSHTGTASKEEN